MTSSPQRMSLQDAAALIADRGRNRRPVYLSGGPGEPNALREIWRETPSLLEGLSLCALFMPGVNRTDYTSLAPGVTLDAFLATPDLQPSIVARRTRVHPISYSAIPGWLRTHGLSVAVVHMAPPNARGECSLGVCADAVMAAVDAADDVVGLINPAMPTIADGPYLTLDRCTIVAERHAPLSTLEAPSAPAADALAAQIADLVPNSACIQIGIGKLPSAVLAALRDKRDLRFHGGLLSPAHLTLLNAGCVRDAPGALTGGIALGDELFYDALAGQPCVRMAPIEHTHNLDVLRALSPFIAINAGLEIDLFGQVNAEWAGARWIASTGGLSDFARGARAADGGRSIIAIQAAGPSGESRIKARLTCPTITLARADADIFVTEYGMAMVKNLDVEARARAIIAIAAPNHRESLAAEWAAA